MSAMYFVVYFQQNASNLALLSPPSLARRRSSVMFSDTVLLHAPNAPHVAHPHNVCSSEKMTQTGEVIYSNTLFQTNRLYSSLHLTCLFASRIWLMSKLD